MIFSTNCASHQSRDLLQLLKGLNYRADCTSFDTENFNHIELIGDVLHVQIAVFLLPRLLIQILIEMVARHHMQSFQYITVEYVPSFIAHAQVVNPLLKFVDLRLVSSLDVVGRISSGNMKRYVPWLYFNS